MRKTMATSAIRALTATGFPTAPGECEKWARLVVVDVYGDVYEEIMHKPTAREAGLSFKKDGRYLAPHQDQTLPGDLLYKLTGSGGKGHVGIRVQGNRVAQNSSALIDGPQDHDARGLMTLAEFGHFDLVVRLPDSKK